MLSKVFWASDIRDPSHSAYSLFTPCLLNGTESSRPEHPHTVTAGTPECQAHQQLSPSTDSNYIFFLHTHAMCKNASLRKLQCIPKYSIWSGP